jgi:hypothetical protein
MIDFTGFEAEIQIIAKDATKIDGVIDTVAGLAKSFPPAAPAAEGVILIADLLTRVINLIASATVPSSAPAPAPVTATSMAQDAMDQTPIDSSKP